MECSSFEELLIQGRNNIENPDNALMGIEEHAIPKYGEIFKHINICIQRIVQITGILL